MPNLAEDTQTQTVSEVEDITAHWVARICPFSARKLSAS